MLGQIISFVLYSQNRTERKLKSSYFITHNFLDMISEYLVSQF